MAEFLERELDNLGVEVKPYKIGQQPGTNIELPPILVGWYPRKDKIKKDKKTLLIYGHYDVQPALTGWTRPVFELTREEKGLKSEKLYGRGSTDDKGPVLAWINAIEAHKKAGVEIPVNLIFCFEGMEESSSAGFPKFLEDHGERIFENVDGAVIADNYWITTEHPCLTYGLRGINYFRVTIEGAPKQLHSGIYGGAVAEPMTDLFSLFSKLVDNKGNILIPGINEQVEELTSAEEDLYKNIHFTREDFIEAVGNNRILYDNATHILMHRWRYPSLSIHGIHGADSSESPGTAIPNKVTGAFSTRTVPNMKSDDVNKAVKDYLNDEFEKLGSKCTIDIRVSPETTPFWRTNPNDRNFQAAAEATEKVYGSKPDYTREGGR